VDDVESPNSRRQLFVAAKRSNERYQSVIKKLRKQNYDLERENFKFRAINRSSQK